MSEANELRKTTNTPSVPEKAPESEHSKSAGDILGDAVHSALYSAVQEPVSGVTQIVDALAGTKFLPKVQFIDAPTQAKFGSLDWHAQTVGSAVGMLVPFLLVGKGVKGVLGESTLAGQSALLSQKAVFGMSMAEAGLTGFAYDAFLRPSNPQHTGASFLLDRGLQGATGAATFMALTGSSLALSKFAGSAAIERSALVPLLRNPIASGVISGIPAGLVSAEGSSLTTKGKFASATELGQAVYGMSVIGGAFGAAHMVNEPRADGSPGRIDALTSKIKAALSSQPDAAPRLGLALAAGDVVDPQGNAEHSISPAPQGKDKAGDTVEPVVQDGELDDALQKLADTWGAKFDRGGKGKKGAAAAVNPVEGTSTDAGRTVEPTAEVVDATKVVPKAEDAVDATKVVPKVEATDAASRTAPVPDLTEKGQPAVWHAKNSDIPVEFHGDAGEQNGVKYVYIKSPGSEGVTGVPASEVELTPAVAEPTGGKSTLDMLSDSRKPDTTIINPDIETTVDSVPGAQEPALEPGKRKVTLPEVDDARRSDLVEGVKSLHETVKAQLKAKETEATARSLELEQGDPGAPPDAKANAEAARLAADQAKQELEVQRQAFTDYVNNGKGDGLQTHLEEVAQQLKDPEAALEVVQHEFTAKQGRELLTSATSDTATAEDRAAFDSFVRENGDNIRAELTRTAEELKNSDIARALVQRAYDPRAINITVEDVGQQAALNAGAKLLMDGKTVDNAKLEQYVKDYGPGMEEHMLKAADQLGHGADIRLQIREAYHGDAMKEGIALLRADTLDPKALQDFAAGSGKALESQMTQSAIDLGFNAEQRLALREAYRGVEAWVPVEGHDGQFVPVKPELEEQYRIAAALLEKASVSDAPYWYVDAVRKFVSENPDLAEPLDLYADATGDRHIQALLREARFGTDNMTVTGKPESIQVGDILQGDSPQATSDRVARFQDFSDLAAELKSANSADLAKARGALFNWLERNPDLQDAALAVGQQSADSRVVGALDSYFGTANLADFVAARQKYEKVASAITPEVIERMNQPGGKLFWDLISDAPETRKWGGSDNIETSKQAFKISKADDGTVTAEFRRHPDGITSVVDAPDGKRTIEYGTGDQLIQLPQGVDIKVKADGSWSSELGNGNYIEENTTGAVQKIVIEDGVKTVVYRDGAIERTGLDGQVAYKEADGTAPDHPVDNTVQSETTDATATDKPARNPQAQADVSALVAKLGSSDYGEASASAIWLKNRFGDMTDAQFVSWLNFAMGTHADAFGTGRQLPNLPDLHMRDGQILMQDNIQAMLRGGDTPEIQSSPEGMARAAANRAIVRSFLDAPEGRPSDLEYPAWLVAKNGLPPDSLPENVLKDLRVRFAEGKVPPDVQEYLDANPEKMRAPKPGDKRPPRGPFSLPKDDVPSRLRTLSDVLQYAPESLQEQLLALGAQDGRALRDVMQVVSPPKGDRDNPQPAEYKRLLELTVPQATDIYTLKLMIQGIKDAAWANKPDQAEIQASNERLANKAAARLMPDSAAAQAEVLDLVSGLATGRYRAPFVPRPKDGAPKPQTEVKKPGSGKYPDRIQPGLRDQVLQEEGGLGDDGELTGVDEVAFPHPEDDVLQQWGDERDGLAEDVGYMGHDHIDPGL